MNDEELEQLSKDVRYLKDRRLEKRDGTWRIALRRATVDAVIAGDASLVNHPFFQQQGYVRGTRDHSHISYQRPITLEGAARTAARSVSRIPCVVGDRPASWPRRPCSWPATSRRSVTGVALPVDGGVRL